MITYWQQENGKLVKTDKEELDTHRSIWVDARNITRDEIQFLEDTYKIEQDAMLDVLDPDELSRIERNDEDEWTLTIIKLPVFNPNAEISYFTAPVGIIIKGRTIITVCWTDSDVLHDFAANRVAELSLNDFPAFIIRVLARADVTFLRYLKELNRRATTIQNEMFKSVENNEFIQLLNIQKSLVFFSTSLKSNQLLLEKLRKTKILKLDEEDQDWLDDVEIDNRQAMEMADTYTNIMSQMNDAFGSVLSNNLNIVMKKMTLISLVMMIPTFITSFFGMNVRLPWGNMSDQSWAGVIIITILCVISVVGGWFLLMGSTSGQRKTIKDRKRLQAERAQKKFLQSQEKKAERQSKQTKKKAAKK